MSYSVITTKIDLRTKKQAMRIAEDLGMPLSVVIKALLKQFIRTKSIHVSVEDEEPTQQLIASLQQSEKEKQEGKVLSFQSKEEVLSYLDKEIAHEEYKK